MSKPAYPTAADLETFLGNAGFTISGLDLNAAIAAGIADFEHAIGYTMLAQEGIRYFDPPNTRRMNPVVDVIEGVVEVTRVTLRGRVLTFGTDYWLKPDNAPLRGRPYRILELWGKYTYPSLPTQRRSLVVEGRWGFADAIPDDAWYAMLVRGGIIMLPTLSAAISRGLVSWSEAGVQENYGQEPLIYLGEGWGKTFDDTVIRYHDVRVGL